MTVTIRASKKMMTSNQEVEAQKGQLKLILEENYLDPPAHVRNLRLLVCAKISFLLESKPAIFSRRQRKQPRGAYYARKLRQWFFRVCEKRSLLLYRQRIMHSYAVIFVLLFPGIAEAQTEFGIKGGMNISDIVMTNYVNPDVESDLGLKLGIHGGIFISSIVNDQIGMAAELLYSNKGVKAISNINLHYMTLPLLVQYQLTDRILAEAGPELGYLFSAQSKHGNVSSTYNNKFDLALDAGLCFNSAKLMFGLRYCVGLFSVREPMEYTGNSGDETIKYQNRVLQLSVGYKLWTLDED